ncbi:MAG: DUF58 domain-containing protein [Chloroflexota bacterium]|nr:DUF58 domain-containing protein [Chloroflexota bacterium]
MIPVERSAERMVASRRVVLGLLGLSLLALAVTGLPIYSRLSYLWGLLLVGSWTWSMLALRGIQVQREEPAQHAHVGQVFEERFIVQNSSRLPRLWLEVHDQSTLPGARGSRVLTLLKGWQRRSYLVRTHLVQRGVFSLGPTTLTSGDPFGLFTVSHTLPSDGSLLVYPMLANVRTFLSPPGLLSGGDALRRRTHQVTPNAAGVREYAPGDPLNRIHWVSTARRERLMVKEFELDPLAEVWIFVDAARSVQSTLFSSPSPFDSEEVEGEGDSVADVPWRPLPEIKLPPSTEEYAVSIAASLGRYFLRHGRAVGLVSCGHSMSYRPNVLPPDRGGRQLGKILEAMALLRAEGALSILALVAAQARHLPRGSTVILITPSTQEDVALAVDHLLRLGLRPVVVLLDAASFDGPPGTKSLAATIAGRGVPVCQVSNGADLGTALSITGG